MRGYRGFGSDFWRLSGRRLQLCRMVRRALRRGEVERARRLFAVLERMMSASGQLNHIRMVSLGWACLLADIDPEAP